MRRPPPWIRFGETGLHVVPSVHHRLVFAQLVYQACRRKPFDVIAVELPPSLAERGLVEQVRGHAGGPRVLIEPTGQSIEMEVPVSQHPHCRRTRRRRVEQGCVLPLTGCDSIVMALRCPELLQQRWPGWDPELRFVDDEPEPVARSLRELPEFDDYEVHVLGLEAFLARGWPRLGSGWVAPVDDRRDRIMAAELRSLVVSGAEVLFVCGAAHWPGIERLLREGDAAPPARGPASDRELLSVSIDPLVAWQRGWLDDFPRVSWAFEKACRSHDARFDKRAALDRVWRESIRRGHAQRLPVSPRRLAKAARYLDRLTGAAGRWTPALEEHLVHVAGACVEERFAGVVREVALEFPGRGDLREEAKVYWGCRDEILLETAGRLFLLPLPAGARKVPLPAHWPHRDRLSPDERAEAEEERLSLRDWPDEIRLRARMEARAGELALELRTRSHSRRFSGSLGSGPDWRRTLRSLARGERTLYVREPGRERQVGDPSHSDPFVWVFDPTASIVGRLYTQWLDEHPPLIASLYYASAVRMLAEGRIEAVELAAFVNLNQLPREVQLAVEGGASRKAAIRGLSRLPPERLCKAAPWIDPELARFQGTDQAIAAGIRYAARRVVVVSRSRQPLGREVVRYAAERGVEIARVPTDGFAPARLERYRWHHFVPAGGDAYRPPPAWCRRFVSPL